MPFLLDLFSSLPFFALVILRCFVLSASIASTLFFPLFANDDPGKWSDGVSCHDVWVLLAFLVQPWAMIESGLTGSIVV